MLGVYEQGTKPSRAHKVAATKAPINTTGRVGRQGLLGNKLVLFKSTFSVSSLLLLLLPK